MSDANRTRVHVAFGNSAAGSLKLALSTLQPREEVLGLGDDLAFGPINPLDASLRLEWGEAELGLEMDPELKADIEEFWTRLSNVPVGTELVAWMSRRSVSEYCGFLEVLRRVDDLSVVDVADMEFVRRDGSPYPEAAKAFAAVPSEQVVAKNLIKRAVRVSPSQREAYRDEWRKVREENAALRVLTPEGLVSAPIDHFDNVILSCITSEWQSCGRVVGTALERISDGPYRQLSADLFLFDRLLKLIDDELVEGKNEQKLWSWRESWVRLGSAGLAERN
jgi:hypothetical protein